MEKQKIKCPYCSREFDLDDVISKPIEEEMRKKFVAEMQKEKALLESELKKKWDEENALTMKNLQAQNLENAAKLEEMRKQELELRSQQRKLEDKAREAELAAARKLDEERKIIEEQATKKAIESHQLKDAEKEKQLADMRKQIEVLKSKSEQGSMQTQGAAWEETVEAVLVREWPEDTIEPIATGVRGADILQKVNTRNGKPCGTIYHECKNAKNWGGEWIPKLKDDQREIKADIAVIVSTVLPKDVRNFALVDDVWVTDYGSFIGLVTALRIVLIEVAKTKTAATGKGEKMELLYNYLAGSEFSQRIRAIVEAFMTMRKDLDAEKKAMQSQWAKREKQIDRVIENTTGLGGDIQGIIGASLPAIDELGLQALTDESEKEQ